MSFQAVTWAIEQIAGSPSAKATLWSIANYANERWCAWPSQRTICEESEQSPDAVQRRLPDLEARGLIRRIPLRFAGRKTVDFVILAPSPYFKAALPDIEPLLPRGCSVDPRFAAADCGNVVAEEDPIRPPDSANGAAADRGSGKTGVSEASEPALPQTLPQPLPQIAADAAALERQQEPLVRTSVDDGGVARACEAELSREAFEVTKRIAVIAGIGDAEAWPPGWKDAASRVGQFLREGYAADGLVMAATEVMASRRDPDPPWSVEYFAKHFVKVRARRERPLPVAQIQSEPEKVIVHGAARPNGIAEAGERRIAQLRQHLADQRAATTENGEGAVRLRAGDDDVQMLAPRRREQP